jgi:transposase
VIDEAAIAERYRAVTETLDERRRRLWAAAEARSLGWGGIAAVARASGISENTIRAGLREIESGEWIGTARIRRAGGGRKRINDTHPTLVDDLERLVAHGARNSLDQPWTAKSLRKLADAMREFGHEVSHQTVARLLHSRGCRIHSDQAWPAAATPGTEAVPKDRGGIV